LTGRLIHLSCSSAGRFTLLMQGKTMPLSGVAAPQRFEAVNASVSPGRSGEVAPGTINFLRKLIGIRRDRCTPHHGITDLKIGTHGSSYAFFDSI
jgi:hypothetical protein